MYYILYTTPNKNMSKIKYKRALRNVDRLPDFCAWQCVDEGVALCIPT